MIFRRALERLRDEYKADSESLAHSEAISIMRLLRANKNIMKYEWIFEKNIFSLDDNPALLTKNGLDKYTFDPQPLNVWWKYLDAKNVAALRRNLTETCHQYE